LPPCLAIQTDYLVFFWRRRMKDVKQPRALATRESITRAAAALFALKGYHDTTLEDVRRAAEITTGAFFHHFASKEDLGFAVLDRHMEKRRQELDRLEQDMPAPGDDDPLERVFRRLDAIAQMVAGGKHRKGGCIIGNLSTALSDTHEAFRQRLASCFDEMAMEFQPHLDAAVKRHGPRRSVDTKALARYIVAVIEGSIMLARTQRDIRGMAGNVENLKVYLKQILGA
jgi:TetR/AcrR family transcriptional regulator, transcriptional repressor for nem operon